jgi:hypothetical protein
LLQRRFNHIAVIAAAISGIAVGCLFTYQLTRLPSGYVASYVTVAVLAATVLLALVGALLLAYWRTRSLGIGLIIAGLVTFATYVVGSRVLLAFDRIPWHPPAIYLVSGQSVVIRFKSGTTEEQAKSLMSSKLPFLPYWSDSLEREPMELALRISDTAYRRGETSPGRSKMLADDVSAFMVFMRRDPRVSSVELQSQH